MSAKSKIAFVISTPMTAEAFLTNHIRAMGALYDVHVIANARPDSIRHPDLTRASWHRARIEREIAPLADLRAVFELASIMRRERFTVVHSITPKAGLLAALAAWISGVPVRVHTFTGQVWATRAGAGRMLLRNLDRLIATLDTHVLVDSASQRDFLRRERVLGSQQGDVIGSGSVCGVDSGRFRPDPDARSVMRAELGIAPNALVFLFMGRLTRDKGVIDLAHAFDTVAARAPDAWLVLVGPDEEDLATVIREACGRHAGRVRFAGYTREPERYMAAADVFCLPSYREGFGTVIVEAAAAGLPAIGSRIYGIVDAIEDGATGLLVEPRSPQALAQAMLRFHADRSLRERLGEAARARAVRDFQTAASTAGWLDFYGRAIASTSRARRQAA